MSAMVTMNLVCKVARCYGIMDVLVEWMTLVLTSKLLIFLVLLISRLPNFLARWSFEGLDIWFKAIVILFDRSVATWCFLPGTFFVLLLRFRR